MVSRDYQAQPGVQVSKPKHITRVNRGLKVAITAAFILDRQFDVKSLGFRRNKLCDRF